MVAGVRDAGEIAAVYNLRVAEDHTYFVGDPEWGFSVWTHNDCYRGDSRPPEEIFGSDGNGPGFEPWGDDMDLQSHIDGNMNSGYVSTSSEQSAAAVFGPYAYTIDDQPTGIDVSTAPGISYNPNEHEIAVPGGIPAGSIEGAYVVDPRTDRPIGPFIPNPGYPGLH